MFQNLRQFFGRKLAATDGEIGHIRDFYFDDLTWTIRYLVVASSNWLSGRELLISVHAFQTASLPWTVDSSAPLAVNLTRRQIQDSPPIEEHRPVSRQYEAEYHRYYGWPCYWQENDVSAVPLQPAVPHNTGKPLTWMEGLSVPQVREQLRSVREVTGYEVQATDGTLGKVSSFMIEKDSWAIREIVLDIGHWYSGKPILLLPENVVAIQYEVSRFAVNLSKADLKHTLKYGLAQAETLYAVPS